MQQPRLVPLFLLLASALVVGGALFSQYVGGLQPCELCLYQRWPYYAMIALAALALAAGGRAAASWLAAAGALLFAAGAVLAFYHVGVEHKWFAGPTACTGSLAAANSVEALKAQIMGLQPVRCDEPQWSLFGVTLAGWNLLASLGLAGFCLLALRRLGVGRHR
jgi:disulfide bond formation protein DsbB